jgi:hypothetical protein
MMNDRFSAQLRQHLVENANEHPAEGQFAAIVGQVAVTAQRRPLLAWLPGYRVRIAGLPAAVRYGLLAVTLVLAALAGAILAGGGGPRPSTPFEGTWTTIDVPDGSTMNLYVGAGTTPSVRFEDLFATGEACIADQTKVFTADGVGEISGNRLDATFPNGGGCGLETVAIAGTYVYDPDADTLVDQDAIVWTRVPRGDGPLPTLSPQPTADPSPTPSPTRSPTLRPTRTQTPAATLLGGCIDLTHGGTYTAPDLAGSMSVTAIIPARALIPWYGSPDTFELAGSCVDGSPVAFHVSGATGVNDGGCMTSTAEIADFADAIARLDAPKGTDISDRIDLTIDGHPAARYDISDLSICPGFGLWNGTILGEGETGSVYVIDVDGTLLEIELNRDGNQTPAELEEAHAIIASLQFR